MSPARRSSSLVSGFRLGGTAVLALALLLGAVGVAQLALSNGQALLGGLAAIATGGDAATGVTARAHERALSREDRWRDAAWRRQFVLELRRHRFHHAPLPSPA
jgi:hypothetical protein